MLSPLGRMGPLGIEIKLARAEFEIVLVLLPPFSLCEDDEDPVFDELDPRPAKAKRGWSCIEVITMTAELERRDVKTELF